MKHTSKVLVLNDMNRMVDHSKYTSEVNEEGFCRAKKMSTNSIMIMPTYRQLNSLFQHFKLMRKSSVRNKIAKHRERLEANIIAYVKKVKYLVE